MSQAVKTENPDSQYLIINEPYYQEAGDEISLYKAAYDSRIPMMLKGPTGCGKTRFIEHMAWRLARPLITISCHEDMTASDLIGRYLLDANGTYWQDGPLTTAARIGAICYLDEVVEARQDTTVAIHSLTDYRRTLSLEKKGELLHAHEDFQLVISYNPGYQTLMKDLKTSTKQRFAALEFSYPDAETEATIVCHETGLPRETADRLIQVAKHARNLVGHGLNEGISTRLLVYTAQLIQKGIPAVTACQMALVRPLSDDMDIRETLEATVLGSF
ncbi:CbbQ/NirQ/NorQ/GpvN family protein [Enterovibrio sp. ZSDZ35]|uniref:CbbQ/NirQ/NorQ/GpvN family protein n=1 Tax=Enterovibrio qingdaonensis TaxID=2899818 RepID=A0ABT5QIL2_9GAMM|nr:CbbQ/NirQ/NorQ/GpvN family protein [Enterovibrio sp. ZSDZ35]MDD1780694.1 CbbQ/NirQ/NorQ/GpvN family protein [Enterovibrio sp. ZSDZ35]